MGGGVSSLQTHRLQGTAVVGDTDTSASLRLPDDTVYISCLLRLPDHTSPQNSEATATLPRLIAVKARGVADFPTEIGPRSVATAN